MKKNVLSLAVATATLSAATAHSAMYLNNEGTGEVLMFPFYDAENGNATNMHIVNTTGEPKAVKVRFLEYKSSYEVLDFNLYLSEYDHFAFGVIMDPNGTGGALITSDNSCTVPALGSPNNGFDGTTTENADGSITRVQPFVNFEFVKGKFVDQAIERTLRGHVEVIEMGVVTNSEYTQIPDNGKAYKTYATHGADGVPANCAGLEAAWATGGWSTDPDEGMTAPTGGLYGLAYHINVEDAAAWGFEPAAIDDWWKDSGVTDARTTAHAVPGTILPNLNTTFEDTAIVINNGVSGNYTYEQGVDAVSATLMTKSISNDVQLNAAVGGQTDWVTTFPTKRPYVTTIYAGRVPTKQPFTKSYFGRRLNSAETAYEEKRACEAISVLSWDREEAQTTPGNGFSPRPPGAAALSICDEQNTTAWGAGSASALNVERDLTNLGFSYTEGWSKWTFPDDATKKPINYLCDAGSNGTVTCLEGLPLIGFAAYKYANGSTAGVMMNYGHAADHKTDVVTSLISEG
jgi:hypothetical protein